jgi:hypothetical protein
LPPQLPRIAHEALRIGGPGAVAELRTRILADSDGHEPDRWRAALDAAWTALHPL